MRVVRRISLVIVFFCFLVSIALAHPGNTDSRGGHVEKSSGSYHYHHGYPAHYHTNGVCPYDFDDKTGWNSGTSSPQKQEDKEHNSGMAQEDNENAEKASTFWL